MLRQSWQRRGPMVTLLAFCVGTACERNQAPVGEPGTNTNGGTTSQSTGRLLPGAGGASAGPTGSNAGTPISAGGTGSPGMAIGRGAGGASSATGGAGMAGSDRSSAAGAASGKGTGTSNPVDPGGGAR
jgi:hypothetical protein